MYTWNLDNAVHATFLEPLMGKACDAFTKCKFLLYLECSSILERNSITQSHRHTTARIFDKILCSSCQRVMQFPKHAVTERRKAYSHWSNTHLYS